LRNWGIRVESLAAADIRAALSKMSEKFVCRICGARHPRIATESPQTRDHGSRREDVRYVERVIKAHGNWLYGQESSLLLSFLKQAKAGRSLSSRQREVIRGIEEKAGSRGNAKLVSGGGPGTGGRR
jgi:hypothetical protein